MTKTLEEETFIEYPCHFPIKVMGANSEDFEALVFQLVRTYLEHDSHIEIKQQTSKKGNYLSLTLTLWVTSRTQLDDIYTALSNEARCVMVL